MSAVVTSNLSKAYSRSGTARTNDGAKQLSHRNGAHTSLIPLSGCAASYTIALKLLQRSIHGNTISNVSHSVHKKLINLLHYSMVHRLMKNSRWKMLRLSGGAKYYMNPAIPSVYVPVASTLSTFHTNA